MPSMDWVSFGSSGAGGGATLSVESDPPGADARASTGGTCRTPCALPVQASGDFTVTIALNGYLPQNVPVRLIPGDDPRFTSEGAGGPRLDPNPVFVELERAPPPAPPARKRPAAKPKPRVAPTARSAPAPAPAAAAPAPAASQAAQPASSTSAPWPMPR